MNKNTGTLITEVIEHSPAAEAGIEPGHTIVSINGSAVNDEIDLVFLQADDSLEIVISDVNGSNKTIRIRKRYERDLGLRIAEMKVRRCNSKCVFCFIDQNPPGLRQPLYFKDGDFRMSFLHGNYITTNDLSAGDLQRIIEQRLSPLYVSVHTTNPELRLKMLGVTRGPSILDRLRHLIRARIQIHAQIVLCPGLNDGEELARTVRELCALGEHMLSIAVVPVGLTDYREKLDELRPVTPQLAREILSMGKALQQECLEARGEQVLFFSDEFYILADEPWPNYADVDVLHQLENGVGMLYKFYDGFDDHELPGSIKQPTNVAALTGLLGARALDPLAAKLNAIDGVTFDVVPLMNSLFGRGVTVSGLLPGRDFLNGIRQCPSYDRYLIPENALRRDGDLFLDDMSLEDLRTQTGADIRVVEADAFSVSEQVLE